MKARQIMTELPPRTTSLYDPVLGFAYTYDLFEKDLYRQTLSQSSTGHQVHSGGQTLHDSGDRSTHP